MSKTFKKFLSGFMAFAIAVCFCTTFAPQVVFADEKNPDQVPVIWRTFKSGAKNDNGKNAAILQLKNMEAKGIEAGRIQMIVKLKSPAAETRFNFGVRCKDNSNATTIGFNASGWYWQSGDKWAPIKASQPQDNSELKLDIKFEGDKAWLKINDELANDGETIDIPRMSELKDEPIGIRMGSWGTQLSEIQFKNFQLSKIEQEKETVVVSSNNDEWVLLTNQNGEIFDEGKPLSLVNVNGKVTNKEGTAIVGASVSIDEKTSVTTNEAGGFSLSDVATGNHTLNVKKQGYINYSKEITVTDTDLDLEDVVLGTPEALNIDFSNYIETDDMKVAIDTAFPRVIGYEMKKLGNKRMYGQTEVLNVIRINNVDVIPTITSKVSEDKTTSTYEMTVKNELAKIDAVITAELKAVKNTLEFKVIAIKNNIPNSVKTIFIPNHNLVSARSNQMNSKFDGANMSVNVAASGDKHTNVTLLPVGNAGYMCAFVSADGLSAGVYSNSSSNAAVNGSGKEDWQQITASTTSMTDGVKNVGILSSAWTYQRGEGYRTEDLPFAKVVVTGDQNDDNAVDWQDGAIAYRDIMNNPVGSEKVPDMVAWRICMNFSGQASNPFLMTLDNVKKVYLHTDGLGQSVLLKGYGSEGHDSGHLNYADIGRRIGGAEDMKTLLHEGGLLGANFGVHVNASETYPESKYFTEDRLKKDASGNYSYGWNWLDQGVNIDADYDLRNGRAERFKDFYDELGGEKNELDYIYVDVWGNGQSGDNGSWASRQLAREIQKLGWAVSGEWGYAFADDSIFQHWASDLTYGGANLKGINSEIFRFIRNHQKDSWVGDYPSYGGAAVNPLLGGNDMKDFEGWQGRNDYNGYITNLFEDNLATKFVQHHKVVKWVDGEPIQLQGQRWTPEKEITLKDDAKENTLVISRKSMDPTDPDYQKRKMTYNSKVIMEGDQYLIPWFWDANGIKLAEAEEKLYHYNETSADATTTWELPESWKALANVKMYTLTETGKQKEQTVAVVDGKVTLKALPKVPYVIHKGTKANVDVKWSEHMHIVDGNFNSTNLNAWTITGEKQGVSLVKSTGSLDMLTFSNKTNEVALTQEITDLKPGVKYAAYVGVDNRSNAKAYIEVNANGVKTSNYTQKSIAPNYISSYAHNNNASTATGIGSKFQNMYVFFTAPQSGKTTLTLRREAAKAEEIYTYMDDIRIFENSSVDMYVSNNKFVQGFEDVPQGLFPFVVGGVEGVTDNRSHLAQKHEPYTKQGWNDVAISDVVTGDWAVKTNGLVQSSNMVYQTIPQNYRFEPGKTYNIQFDYASGSDNTYALVIGNGEFRDSGNSNIIPLKGNPYKPATTYKFRLTGDADGQSWFGIYSNNVAADKQGVAGAKATFCGFESFVLDNLIIQQSDVTKATLEKAVLSNSAYYAENYSKDSFNAYQAALTSAQSVLDNFNATQVQVNDAETALLNAVKNLEVVAGTVRGKVETSEVYYGETYKYPVSDVEVSIKLADGVLIKAKTNSDGIYIVQGAAFGKAQIVVDDSKYLKYTSEIEITKDKPAVEADIILKEAQTSITGKVLAFNKPVSGVVVTANGPVDAYTVTTNENGEYKFENAIAGKYTLETAVESFEDYRKEVFASKEASLNHNIILEPKSDWDYTNNYDNGVVAWDNLTGNTLSTTIRSKDNGTNILFSSGYSNVYETNAPRFKDGSVEMDITSEKPGIRLGIMLRGNNMNERIYVGVGDSANDYFAEHYSNSECEWTNMHTGESFDAGKTMHLKAEIVEKTVKLWVNGKLTLTEVLNNVHLTEGYIGLSTRNSHNITVDNVKVVSYDPPSKDTRNVIGKVTLNNSALEGAQIVLKKADAIVKTVNSNSYGYFKFKNISYGEYTVEATNNGKVITTNKFNITASDEAFVLSEINMDNAIDKPIIFTTTFNVDGKETVVATNAGETIVMPATPTKDGYKFKGWFTAATEGTEVTNFNTVQTVYAQWIHVIDWTPVKFTTTFNVDGKETVVATNAGETIVMPAIPTKDGYKFKGWFTAATEGTEVTNFNTVQTVYAQWIHVIDWTPVKFTTTFNIDGKETVVVTNAGETIVMPATPVKDGYEFKGWFTAATEGTEVTNFDTVQTVYAQWIHVIDWTPVKFATTFYIDGKETVVATNVGEKIVMPAIPTKDGYKFKGWFTAATEGTEVTNFDTVQTVYAQFSKNLTPEVPKIPINTTTYGNTTLSKDVTVEDANKTGMSAFVPKEVTNVTNPKLINAELPNWAITSREFAAAANKFDIQKTFIINLFDSETKVTKVEGGKIKIEIPFAGVEGKEYVVLRYNDDKTVTELKATYADGKISFETDHFSVYAVAVKAVANTKPTIAPKPAITPKTTTNVPKTGDTTSLGSVMILFFLAGTLILARKKLCK